MEKLDNDLEETATIEKSKVLLNRQWSFWENYEPKEQKGPKESDYSKQLKDSLNAVIISPDEATYELINNEQGEFYNVFSERLNKYLTRKVGEIAKAGANVIFERGLWSSKDRKEIKEYYKNNGVDCEIHYVCVDDDTWKANIAERNQRVLDGNGGSDFYLDEGLMKKLESKWEEPTEDEYDVIYKVKR